MTIHRVYWSHNGTPLSIDHEDLLLALKHTESLRKMRRDGFDISHVVISSEIVDCTSLTGVDSPSPDYNWKKRRI
jgi:hypothetical protein